MHIATNGNNHYLIIYNLPKCFRKCSSKGTGTEQEQLCLIKVIVLHTAHLLATL